MRSAIRVFFPALLLIGCLDGCLGDGVGCAMWIPKGLTDVCCRICKPGNHLVQSCGLDPRDLCVPCEAGTYTTDSSECRRCTQCMGAQTVKRACTASSNTVCGCVTGYRCKTAQCTSCIKECERGQEPTEEGTCQTCPEGTFNDQIHQKCTPWRTSCPQPGKQVMAQGTAFHDRTCGNVSVAIPEVIYGATINKSSAPDGFVTVIAGLCLLATMIIAMVCFVTRKILMKKKTGNKPVVEKPLPDGSRQVIVHEDCSLPHPQQEEGGSMDSVTSQLSNSKLLPV